MAEILPFRRHLRAHRLYSGHYEFLDEAPASRPSGLRPWWCRKPRGIAGRPRGEAPFLPPHTRLSQLPAPSVPRVLRAPPGFAAVMLPGHLSLWRLAALFEPLGYRLESRSGIVHVVPVDGRDPEAA